MSYRSGSIEDLVGKKIEHIYMNSGYLKFETDRGNIVFTVHGDCCSRSYFHDFLGVDKLLKNGPVVSAKAVQLAYDDPRTKVDEVDGEYIQVYGYEIVTEDPQYGEVTSVFSFRNSSNGYYGGWMERVGRNRDVEPEITTDALEVA